MDLEAEESWLRKRIMRLRTLLRYANDPRIEVGLREVIADAEHRLEILQSSARPRQQQQQVQPNKKSSRTVASSKKDLGCAVPTMASEQP
jgi:hypothetical protein